MSLLAKCGKHDTVCCRDCFPLPQWADIVDVKELEAERDALHLQFNIVNDHLQKMQVTNGSLTDEVDRLKAELEECRELHEECHVNVGIWKEDRDLWKSKADKLAEALEACLSLRYGHIVWTAKRPRGSRMVS